VVLHARRDIDGLRLDVHGDLEQFGVAQRQAAPAGGGAAHGDVQGRGTREARADRRFRPRRDLDAIELEVVEDLAEQLQLVGRAERRPAVERHDRSGVV
jgi:hypothetical protein